MPTVGYVDSQLVHANNSFVVYDNHIIGKLEQLKLVIDKDVEYDVIIGSGGKPFGQPIVKFTKFYGSFTKGMFKVSDLDKILALDAVGNAHSDFRNLVGNSSISRSLFGAFEHDPSDFTSSETQKFIDENNKSLTFFPVATQSFAIALGGVVIGKNEYEIVNNKFVRMNAEFKGKFIQYFNKLNQAELNATIQ